MLSAFALALSPFVLNLVMAMFKWLLPLETTASKSVILALIPLAGVIATRAMTGAPVDPT